AARFAPALQGEDSASARHPCELPTTCQPPSGWGNKDPWPATIRDISTAGLSLALNRRFERGSGLAIELPGGDGTYSTVLARVTSIWPHPESGWVLGCTFVSELSDEEVRSVLEHNSLRQAGGEAATGAVTGVLFQARLKRFPDEAGEVIRWFI